MTVADLEAVERIGQRVHPHYPEHKAVFAERLRLDPGGCFVLAAADGLMGYAVSHRGRLGVVPALDTLLGALPDDADTRYVHDIALLPERRGGGLGGAIVTLLAERALKEGLASLSLMAVSGSGPFWRRHGFTEAAMPAGSSSYGSGAAFMVRGLGRRE